MTLTFAPSIEARRALAAWRLAAPLGAFRPLSVGELIQRQRNRCYLCGYDMRRPQATTHGRLARSRDHVFPKAEGGRRDSNVLLAHRSCNSIKADRWPTPCEVIFLAAIYASPCARPSRRRFAAILDD